MSSILMCRLCVRQVRRAIRAVSSPCCSRTTCWAQARSAFDGLELQMVDPRYYGDDAPEIPPTELTGGLYRAVAPWEQRYKPGEWNEYVVRLEGPHVTVTLNGETVQKVNLDEESIPITRHDGSPARPLKERPRTGHIGFQELSRGEGHVMIRNARINEMP